MIKLYRGDCLEIMPTLPDKSIDMILCDLPYGTTAGKWDSIIPFELLWTEYRRLIRDNGVIALFSTQPFTTKLISSNLKEFRYCFYWIKNQATNFFHAKRMPLRKIEEVCIFGGNRYYPQITDGHLPTKAAVGNSIGNVYHGNNNRNDVGGKTTRFPNNVLEYKCVNNNSKLHSNEKPVALLEYLIKTYTIKNDTVLDNTMGSGSTGVAAVNTNRKFIGIEMDCPENKDRYFRVSSKRIVEAGGRDIEVIE